MPPSVKSEDCKHPWVLKRTVGFSETEKKQATSQALSLPDYMALEVCVGCWIINPHSLETMLAEIEATIKKETT